MIECKKCKIKINTSVKKCPLCQNELEEDSSFGNFESNVYPYIESTEKNGLWQKILGFIFLLIVVLCTSVDCIINHQITWSIFSDLAVLCVGASISIGLEKKRSLAAILFYEYLFLCPISYYWDQITGKYNWALNYVIPILSSLYIIANFVLRVFFKRDLIRYFRNIFVASVVGIVCISFYMHSLSTIVWPSVVSATIGGTAILSIAVFDGTKVINDLSKRLHI